MTITLELPEDLAQRLAAAAEASGQDLNAYAVAMLRERAAPAPAQTGADIVAFLEREGILGTFADRPDSPEFARQLREQAQTRQW